MSYKKILRTAIVCLVFVWVVCFSTIFVTSNARKQEEISMQNAYNDMLTSTTAPTTTLATTTTPTTVAPTLGMGGNQVQTTVSQLADPDWLIQSQQASSEAAAKTTTKPTTTKPTTTAGPVVPKDKKAIIDAYAKAVNALKAEQNFSLVKTDTLNIVIDEMPGGGMFNSIAESLIANNSPKEPYRYTFTNGFDLASGFKVGDAVAPLNTNVALDENAVISATATPTATGGISLEIRLQDEMQTMTAPAPNHSTSVQVIAVEDLGLPSGATISRLDITYSGTIIKAELDKDGKLLSMNHVLPVSHAEGDGKMTLIPISVKIHGEYTSDYAITYA